MKRECPICPRPTPAEKIGEDRPEVETSDIEIVDGYDGRAASNRGEQAGETSSE